MLCFEYVEDFEISSFLFSRFVFTTDPRGILKLWRLYDPSVSVYNYSGRITVMAEFPSCFGTRIMCLDASFEKEVCITLFLCLILLGSLL